MRCAPARPRTSPRRWNTPWRTPGPHLIEALVPESLAGPKRKVLPWLLKSLPSLPRPVARALKQKIAP